MRDILSRRITDAAERRAQSLAVGAERVLICADAITEEAYLTALAHSLGTVPTASGGSKAMPKLKYSDSYVEP